MILALPIPLKLPVFQKPKAIQTAVPADSKRIVVSRPNTEVEWRLYQ